MGHENIIRYSQRPFACAAEMDEALIANWNAVVRPADHVYCLGDVTMLRGGPVQQRQMAGWVSRLQGHKRLLLGNHDHFPVQAYLAAGFEKVRGTGQWLDGLLLSHYPVHPASLGRAKACIHGHTHTQHMETSPHHRDPRYLNVCVEVTDYRPLTLEECQTRLTATAGHS